MDLKLDGSHDLEIIDRDLQLVDKLDEVAQRLKIQLQFFLGEWFLDTSQGIPYHEEIFVKGANRNRVASLLKEAILKTPCVEEILAFNLEFESETRALKLKFKVSTEFGVLHLDL